MRESGSLACMIFIEALCSDLITSDLIKEHLQTPPASTTKFKLSRATAAKETASKISMTVSVCEKRLQELRG